MVRAAEHRDQKPTTHPPSDNPLTRKLLHFAPLSNSDRQHLDHLAAREERFPANVDIIGEGMVPRSVFLLKEGMAMRYRNMPDGGRQIMTFLIPGDLCDMHVFLLKEMDHSIGTITPVRVAPIPREGIMGLFGSRPRISAALWWSSLQEEAMLRERIVSLGRRDARGRVAYLLCELMWRHAAVGLTDGNVFRLPLTQTELGDTLGLTPVHVNRVLKEFRQRDLISMEHRMMNLLDIEGLKVLAGFNKDYLHLSSTPTEVTRYFDVLEEGQRSDARPTNE
ncbi:Crp/Fnr family transcriptional regulator [Muricoccus aerilatus]|uniref:Crp/Fnr family transcriptional regulator n=1 Tax=Muricoccus aerilatus TaxID=452982 RepID=UPI0009FF8DAE|nr:Crp/Fnr family transcriptional regulator [Roseomonas aerilata]